MATTVTYNGITMHNVITRRWEQEIVYDPSNTDAIGQKFNLTFEGVLHAQRVPIQAAETYIAGAESSASIFSILENVQRLLGTPRARLTVAVGGTTVIDIHSTLAISTGVDGNSTDIDNGPKPTNITVTPIGSTVFQVSFSIEAMVGNCDALRSGKGLVLNNRWSVRETMDQNFHTTRVITGHLRVAAGVFAVAKGWPAHMHKPIVIPPLEDSFRRSKVSFGVEEDGLSCSYEIIDTQVHTAAPWPATSMEATYSESSTHGTFFVSEMNVRLQGNPSTDKRLLIERAIQILNARLQLFAIKDSYNVESLMLTEHIGSRSAIDMSARIKRVDALSTTMTLGLLYVQMGEPLVLAPLLNSNGLIEGTNYDHQLSPLPKPYGFKHNSAAVDRERRPVVLFFLHCYLQNPCDTEHSVGPLTPSETPSKAKPPQREDEPTGSEYPYTPVFIDDENTFSEETHAGIYTMAQMSSRYNTNRMFVQMPIANIPEKKDSEKKDSGNDATSEILQLAGSQNYRFIEVNFERVGLEPDIPEPVLAYTHEDGKVKATLAHFDVEILSPVRSTDGRQAVFRSLAKYVYLLDRTPDFTKAVPVGINPVTHFPDHDGTIKLGLKGDMGIGGSSNQEQTG